MRLHIPIRLQSLANMTHKHWRLLSSITKAHKEATHYCILRHLRDTGTALPPPPLLVTITRIGKRKLDDDNLQTAAKYVRDQIAAEVGLDDGSDQYTWRYEQRIGKEYGVDVEITPR